MLLSMHMHMDVVGIVVTDLEKSESFNPAEILLLLTSSGLASL